MIVAAIIITGLIVVGIIAIVRESLDPKPQPVPASHREESYEKSREGLIELERRNPGIIAEAIERREKFDRRSFVAMLQWYGPDYLREIEAQANNREPRA